MCSERKQSLHRLWDLCEARKIGLVLIHAINDDGNTVLWICSSSGDTMRRESCTMLVSSSGDTMRRESCLLLAMLAGVHAPLMLVCESCLLLVPGDTIRRESWL